METRNETLRISKHMDFPEMCKEIIKAIPLYFSPEEGWFMYNKGKNIWERAHKVEILNAIRTQFRIERVEQTTLQKELFNALELESALQRPQELSRYEVQFEDTIVNIISGEQKPMSPQFFSFNKIPHKIGKGLLTPKIDALLFDWTAVEEDACTLKEWLAYCITRDCTLEEAIVLVGSGSNGKSQYVKLLEMFIGKQNVSHSSFESLFSSTFGRTQLYRRLHVVLPELNTKIVRDPRLFKQVISGGMIDIERKGVDAFDYESYAKISICSNQLPATSDRTDGFYRRWVLVPFPHHFEKKADLLTSIPEIEFENLAKWSITTAKRIIETGRLSFEGNIEYKRKTYEKYSDPLTQFINQKCTEEPEGYILSSEFSTAFSDFLKDNKYMPWGKKELHLEMKKMQFTYDQEPIQDEDGRQSYPRVWRGIRWKDKIIPEMKITYESVN